jgi:putative endopeptidase
MPRSRGAFFFAVTPGGLATPRLRLNNPRMTPARLRRTGMLGAALFLAACATLRTGDSRTGLTPQDLDTSVRPQDNLYRYASGGWLARTTIPSDRSNIGAFGELEVAAQQQVRDLLQEAVAKPAGSPGRKAADLYASFLDKNTVETRGLTPLKAELARIDGLQTTNDLAGYIGYAQTLPVNTPVGWYVGQDARNATAYITTLTQSGLSLPDRDYYLKSDASYVKYRGQLHDYVMQLLQAAGDANASTAADRVVAIEQQLATAQWSRVQNRDPVATYNKLDMGRLADLAPGVDWPAFFAGAAAPVPDVDVDQPGYITALAGMLQKVPMGDWRVYFRYKLLDAYAPLLPAPFEQLHFGFHERALSGVEQQAERWKRGVDLVNRLMGEASGELYVDRHFSASSRQRMRELVGNLIKAFDASIDTLAWMTPPTRAEARRKLSAINVKVGYPDKWRDYSTLEIRRDDLVGNATRASQFEQRRQRNQLGGPIDRGEWGITPETVNAYYNPTMNEVVFPAAILQPPFFNPAADDAVNYGAIGGFIGHELSHGFDDSGRQYDAVGNLRDWWSDEDARRFKALTAALVGQAAAFHGIDDQPLNGELTLGENIADLSGLAIAYKAYVISLGGKPGPTIGGFTAGQRFFLGWGQAWRRLHRDDDARQRLSVDPHGPSEFRVNGPASNMDAFYEAFQVKPGDRLYRKHEDRIRIW